VKKKKKSGDMQGKRNKGVDAIGLMGDNVVVGSRAIHIREFIDRWSREKTIYLISESDHGSGARWSVVSVAD
jgi:hypothetical protein